MSVAPWNKTVTREWIQYDQENPETYPKPGQRVIALDQDGAMAICTYDSMSFDFLVCLDGISKEEIRYSVYAFFVDLLDKFAGQNKHLLKLKNQLQESVKEFKDVNGFAHQQDEFYEAVLDFTIGPSYSGTMEAIYFDRVVAWMIAPPVLSQDLFFSEMEGVDMYGNEEHDAEIHMKTYDVMSAIEPYIREALIKAVKGNAP